MHRDAASASGPSGYQRLYIAHDGPQCDLTDPEGNAVSLVPRGWRGVHGIAIEVRVRNLDASAVYYGAALEFERMGGATFCCGNTLLFLVEDPSQPPTGDMRGPGYRYLTVQVRSVDDEHARVLAAGGTEGSSPRTLGKVARISFVRDPDGNWLEISQRASLTGALPG